MALDGGENIEGEPQDTTGAVEFNMPPSTSAESLDSTTADCGNDDDVSNERTERAQMKAEFYRLRSFRVKGNGWPHKEKPAAPLARAGLYYTGSGDATRCAFCPCSLSSWKKDDDPLERHRQASPDCPFLKREHVGNLPLSLPPGSRTPAQENEFVGVAEARFPDLSLYEARLATYENWPANAQQRPEDLAMAGFFYMGERDKVKCFFCEKKLVSWRRSDDPWLEHIKHQPTCHFVLMNKGSEFVRDVLSSYRQRGEERQRQRNKASSQQVPAATQEVLPTENSAMEAMHKPRIMRVLSMGFPYDDVQVLVQRLMTERGEKNPTTELLLTMLLRMQDRGFTCHDVPLDPLWPPSNSPRRSPAHKPGTSSSRRPTATTQNVDRGICKICGTAEVAVTFQPCGHLACCEQCGSGLKECPICRQEISSRIRTYLT